VLVEPAPALPPELDGEELDDEDAPPLAGLLVVSLELELELDGDEALGELPAPEEDEELGELGEVVAPPADEDDEPEGDVVEPEGEVLLLLAPLGRSPLRLQPVTTAVPSARVTARARVESLMGPPWVKLQNSVSKDRAVIVTPPSNTAYAGCQFSVLHGGLRVAALRTGPIAAVLEIAMLIRVLRVYLSLYRVRALLFLRACRISRIGRGRRRSRGRRAHRRHAVGFR
jgi:hypothetical protein